MKRLLFLILLILTVGCTIDANVVIEEVQDIEVAASEENNGEDIELYFCPENCYDPLYELIDSATESVHCAFFDLDLEGIIGLFEDKSSSIDVKVVVDGENEFHGYDWVRFDTTSQYSHNKFCVVDGKRISTGSFNPTQRGAFFNNNNMVIMESDLLSDNFEKEFVELWQGDFGEGENVEHPKIVWNDIEVQNYFCPEDHCGDMIYEEIKKAKSEVYFMIFSFTHGKVANGLVMKKDEGLHIQGIFERTQKSKYSKFELLDFQNISVKWDKSKYNMHNKVFVIDNETVITGSFNPSNNADKNNDENIMIIKNKEIASAYLKEWQKIWNYRVFIEESGPAENIVISEVMYDPEGKDSGSEYIVLKNLGAAIDLNHWKLSSNKSNMVLNFSIGSNSEKKVFTDFSLKNNDGIALLIDNQHNLVDYVRYKGAWDLIDSPLVRTKFTRVRDISQWK